MSPGDERPGSDAEAIRRLFGQDSLDWWCSLTLDERRSRTLSKGLEFLPDLAGTALDDAQEARAGALAGTVDCNTEEETQVWCRWTPSRSGYYQLAVGGAWGMESRTSRAWKSARELATLRDKVMRLSRTDRDRIRQMLGQVGCGQGRPVEDSCRFNPDVLGLNPGMTDILPTGTPDDDWDTLDRVWLWRSSRDTHRFGGSDLRVTFRNGPDTTMYTETQEFGIQVHEVRVATVSPSR